MDNIYAQLEDYLDGKLSEVQKNKLEEQIAADEQIAEQLAMLRLERELGRLMLDDKLDAKMEAWAAEKEARRKAEGNGAGEMDIDKRTGNNNSRWMGILLLVVAIGLAYWLLSPGAGQPEGTVHRDTEQPGQIDDDVAIPEKPIPAEEEARNTGTEETPAKKNIQKPAEETPKKQQPIAQEEPDDNNTQLLAMALTNTRPVSEINFGTKSGTSPEGETPFDKGYRLMGEGKLKEARQSLMAIPEEERGLYLNAQQYIAFIQFEQKNYTEAIPILESLLEIGYADEYKMQWLLALSYMAAGKQKEGMKIMDALAGNEDAGKYREQAQAFLEE